MSMNLCCFYFLTRPRNKVEIAPIENHSKIQPEVIIQESPKIEEILSPKSSPKTPKITNTILQPTIEVINIQPKISQTIVTYNQNPQPVNEIKPHTPKRRFSLVLVPIAQAVPQTVIKLGKSLYTWVQKFNHTSYSLLNKALR